jgi:hypothetical protein
VEVFVEFAPIGAAEPYGQAAGVVGHEVEDRPVEFEPGGHALRPLLAGARAEETLEHQPRVRLRRGRLRGRPPGDVELVGAGIPGVARAALPHAVAGELERREARRDADAPRRLLIDRHADTDVAAGGLERPGAGEDRRRGPRVVAGAVATGGAMLMAEAGDDLEIALEGR